MNVRAPPELSFNSDGNLTDGPGPDVPRRGSKDSVNWLKAPARRLSIESFVSEINDNQRGSKLEEDQRRKTNRNSIYCALNSEDKPKGSVEVDESIIEDGKVKHFEMMRYAMSVIHSKRSDMKTQLFEAWKDFTDDQKELRKQEGDKTPLTMLHPGGRLRITLDCLGAVFIIYDLFMTPVILCFDDFFEPWILAITTFTFWTLEMFSGFELRSRSTL